MRSLIKAFATSPPSTSFMSLAGGSGPAFGYSSFFFSSPSSKSSPSFVVGFSS
eukprot:CAMPEP_0204533506 /NCGR_PEP_ID=MMETSP0661-20131031/12325_1 /ASSEMBLY_ACC=CAM_ASM_000606 /TAXON_ID=109239 /ORGANISM="Alexandrium margalefi, Strain AMGDE01CS-322" /LENGTH=52 /DNA_ID=CAMNT_0051539857 /DNA_START=421 /DNA_END=576 /DNA_ORIENTATION=-